MGYRPVTTTLVLLALAAASPVPAAPPEDAIAAAARCRLEVQPAETIVLNSGVYTEEVQVSAPLSVRVPGPMDPRAFEECMARLGFAEDVRNDRYLRALEECRADGTVRRSLRYERAGAHISGGGPEALEACIRRRLGEVEVEVLDPGAED
jgi:hypothetical protein